MENMRGKFALYSKIVVDFGHASLDLANGIQKFNAQLRPDYAPVQAFTHGQFTFREEVWICILFDCDVLFEDIPISFYIFISTGFIHVCKLSYISLFTHFIS